MWLNCERAWVQSRSSVAQRQATILHSPSSTLANTRGGILLEPTRPLYGGPHVQISAQTLGDKDKRSVRNIAYHRATTSSRPMRLAAYLADGSEANSKREMSASRFHAHASSAEAGTAGEEEEELSSSPPPASSWASRLISHSVFSVFSKKPVGTSCRTKRAKNDLTVDSCWGMLREGGRDRA